MFNSDMLEVAIGLVFIYLVFSFVATAARESLEAMLKQRGAYLEQGILSLVSEPHGDDQGPLAPQKLARPTVADAAPRASAAEAAAAAETILEQIYRSPPVHGLFRDNYVPPAARAAMSWRARLGVTRKLPSYIPSEQFAEGVLAVVARYSNPGAGGAPGSLDRLRLAVEGVPNPQVRNIVRTAIQLSGGDPERMRQHIQDWYDGAMDRVSGVYRRHTQWWVLLSATAIAVALNVNTIVIVQTLDTNATLRGAIVKNAELAAADQAIKDAAKRPAPKADSAAAPAAAAQASTDQPSGTPGAAPAAAPAGPTADSAAADAAAAEKADAARNEMLKTQLTAIRSAGIPIGWDSSTRGHLGATVRIGPEYKSWPVPKGRTFHPLGWIAALLGWLMTGFAISLGAPFWFDVLNKVMIVRATVKPEEKSREEDSKDKGASGGQAANVSGSAAKLTNAGPAPISEEDRLEIAALDPNERPREGDLAPAEGAA